MQYHHRQGLPLSPEQMERQLATSLTGPMSVTRAVLPLMRKQRSATS